MVRGIRKDKGRKQSERVMRGKQGGMKEGGKGESPTLEKQRKESKECSISAPLFITHLSLHLQRLRGKACIVFTSHQKRTNGP